MYEICALTEWMDTTSQIFWRERKSRHHFNVIFVLFYDFYLSFSILYVASMSFIDSTKDAWCSFVMYMNFSYSLFCQLPVRAHAIQIVCAMKA